MIQGHPEILLYRPEIPQNVGAIGRLAAGAGSRLHLVGPFPFALDDKNLRRPGLDYWPFLDLEIHDDIESVLKRFDPKEIALFSKKGSESIWKMPASIKLLVFGQETSGLPESLCDRFPKSIFRIPIYHQGVRSLNLANAVSIATYHHLFQKSQLETTGSPP